MKMEWEADKFADSIYEWLGMEGARKWWLGSMGCWWTAWVVTADWVRLSSCHDPSTAQSAQMARGLLRSGWPVF